MTGFRKVTLAYLPLIVDNFDDLFLMVLKTQAAYETLNSKYDTYLLDYVITKGKNTILFQVTTITPDDNFIILYIYTLDGKLLDIYEKEC